MKRVFLLVAMTCIVLAQVAVAQQNAQTDALESLYKNFDGDANPVGSAIKCSLSRAPQSLFGLTEVKGQTPALFLVSELANPFAVGTVDENCALVSSWNTAFGPGATETGIAYDSSTGSTYWAINLRTNTIDEFNLGTGTATGNSVPMGAGVWGPLTIDDNPGGTGNAYTEDIATDKVFEINLATGTIGCTFPNPDDAGSGAFGNGLDDAADPGACSGATLVITHGTIAEGQVTSASQTDCSGVICADTWDLFSGLNPVGETFANGIVEYVDTSDGSVDMAVAGNATGAFYILEHQIGVTDCQGKDGELTLKINNRSGAGTGFQLTLNATDFMRLRMNLPSGGGNGKFLVHENAGAPSAGTIVSLPAQLGSMCFPVLTPPFGSAAPASVWNNIGKTNKVGASNYFGTSIANPGRAPINFWTNQSGDPTNMPSGSVWTFQGIILNPAGSSPKNASVTNAIQVNIN